MCVRLSVICDMSQIDQHVSFHVPLDPVLNRYSAIIYHVHMFVKTDIFAHDIVFVLCFFIFFYYGLRLIKFFCMHECINLLIAIHVSIIYLSLYLVRHRIEPH